MFVSYRPVFADNCALAPINVEIKSRLHEEMTVWENQ